MWKRQYTRWQQKRVDNALFVFNITSLVLSILLLVAACFWLPMVLGLGLVCAVEGIVRLVAAARGWDAFVTFRVCDEKASYTFRHIFAIATGLLFLLFGIGFDAWLIITWLGVIG